MRAHACGAGIVHVDRAGGERIAIGIKELIALDPLQRDEDHDVPSVYLDDSSLGGCISCRADTGKPRSRRLVARLVDAASNRAFDDADGVFMTRRMPFSQRAVAFAGTGRDSNFATPRIPMRPVSVPQGISPRTHPSANPANPRTPNAVPMPC